MTTIDIGDQYENFICTILKNEYDEVWLTKNIPSYAVNLCGFKSFQDKITCDIGFDILGIKNNQLTFIQCKNYTSNICISDLAGFCAFCACYSNRNWKFITYYNGYLSHHIRRFIDDGSNIKFINIVYNNIIYDQIKLTNFIPRLYQLEAYDKLKYCEDKGLMYKLHMPCGMGKTYISYLLSRDYKNTIILSPLKTHAKQILNTFKKYYGDINILYHLISSDSLRKVSNLGEKNIISSTYDSCNIINKIKSFKNTLIIIDEYHNISDNDKEINYLIEHLSCPILFISATPKLEKYGNNLYEYKWKDAIDNGYISDYKIYCANINKNYEGYLISIYGKDKLPNEYWSAYNLIYGMILNNHSRCIIYLNSIEKCNNMELMIKFVNMHFKQDITVMVYTSDIKLKKKNAIYDDFMKKDKTIKIICSVKILNEAVDIPICDSVYIISESLNIINIIQRICRCNRKINEKISGIYIWSQNIDKIKEIIINTLNDDKFTIIKYEDIAFIENKDNNINKYNTKITELQKTTLLNYLKKCPNSNTTFIDNFFESNIINTLVDDNKIIWFKSIDIAKSLGYIDIKDAIQTHINSDNKKYLSEINININIKGHPSTIYINEAGLYELLLKSKLKKALKFKKWVTSDIL